MNLTDLVLLFPKQCLEYIRRNLENMLFRMSRPRSALFTVGQQFYVQLIQISNFF